MIWGLCSNSQSMCKIRPFRFFWIVLFLAFYFINTSAQKAPDKNWSSSRIVHELEKMKHVGRILYIAAHPDDENTQLISYLVNVKGIETAYMSLTRGDGGQDLIGPEVREELGVMRTEELLMARSVDGGEQFFSRANDFGFSKTAKETMHIWDSTEVLSDIVWVIRKFKPDIIITRFSPTYTKTHGHHTASAILAQKAFTAAADPRQFPEQLKYIQPWQAMSLFWNTSTFFFQDGKMDTAGLYYINIGTYMPLLGKGVGEIAAESRSMHKSQGFGVSARRGNNMEYFVQLAGKKPDGRDIFSVTNFNWNRINKCDSVPAMIEDSEAKLDVLNPSAAMGSLGRLYNFLYQYSGNYLVAAKVKQLQEILLECAGVYAEAISIKQYLTLKDSITVNLGIICPTDTRISVDASLLIDNIEAGKMSNPVSLTQNENKNITIRGLVSENTTITGPYWLENEPTVGMYIVGDQWMRGLPENPHQVILHIKYTLDGLPSNLPLVTFEKDIPVFYKNTDPVKGEVYSLTRIVPPAVANPETKLMVFAGKEAQKLAIKVKSFGKGKATIKLSAPAGWVITPASLDIDLKGNSSEIPLDFSVTPPANAQIATLLIVIEKDGNTYNRSLEDINYDHIPEQMLLPKSRVKVVKMDIKTSHKLIGYINGAGDDIPQLLSELGYKVEIITPSQLGTANLIKYDAIIAGVRAYNTVERLKYDNHRLMEYVKNGGNYIVQYNNNFRLVTDSIGPYYLHPANVRTTEEDSKITFLNKNNTALNKPNKITDADFDGWVQERGLYYPDKWDTTHYVPLLEMHDTGEPPVDGALVVTKHGKGNFVYTGLSFFRELPAGVPGAYRLFVNLIELPKNE